jgi:hypothetical protein
LGGKTVIKLCCKSVNLIASMLGGLLAGLIFKGAWKIIGRGDEPPRPTDEQQGWGDPAGGHTPGRDIPSGQGGL